MKEPQKQYTATKTWTAGGGAAGGVGIVWGLDQIFGLGLTADQMAAWNLVGATLLGAITTYFGPANVEK
jgi:hypothetical protein